MKRSELIWPVQTDLICSYISLQGDIRTRQPTNFGMMFLELRSVTVCGRQKQRRGHFNAAANFESEIRSEMEQNKRGTMHSLIATICTITIFFGLSLAASPARAKESVAVVVVDVQGDFTTARNGSLAVPNTDQSYLENVSKVTERLKKSGLPVYATQDWHPANHMSFASNHNGKKSFDTINLSDGRIQVLWPTHCLQETDGAKILLNQALITKVVRKGMDPKFDSYSGFMDDGGAKTELDKALKAADIKTLIVYGVATDYCVKATVLDGLKEGYNVYVVSDLCRGVDAEASKAALEEMKQKGATIWNSLDMEKIKDL